MQFSIEFLFEGLRIIERDLYNERSPFKVVAMYDSKYKM